jgi:hypothetical protein
MLAIIALPKHCPAHLPNKIVRTPFFAANCPAIPFPYDNNSMTYYNNIINI